MESGYFYGQLIFTLLGFYHPAFTDASSRLGLFFTFFQKENNTNSVW